MGLANGLQNLRRPPHHGFIAQTAPALALPDEARLFRLVPAIDPGGFAASRDAGLGILLANIAGDLSTSNSTTATSSISNTHIAQDTAPMISVHRDAARDVAEC